MTEIKIAVETTIFDDPEYCNSNEGECRLIDDWERCPIFGRALLERVGGRLEKLQECKEAWKNAKESQTVGFKTDSFPHIDGGAPETVTLIINGKIHKYAKEKQCDCEPFQSCGRCAK